LLCLDLLRNDNNARTTIDAGIGEAVNAFIMENFSFGAAMTSTLRWSHCDGGMKKANSAAQVMVNDAFRGDNCPDAAAVFDDHHSGISRPNSC
jgi:hypothetical protein